jgi:hypothetical protein
MTEIVTKKLGEFDLEDVRAFAENLRDQKDAAFDAFNELDDEDSNCEFRAASIAEENEARFNRAAAAVIPLLEAHPGWTWRTAVEHMQANGTLPSLDGAPW